MAKINSVEANMREKGKHREEFEPPNSGEQLPKLLTKGVGGAGDDGFDRGGSSTGSESGKDKPCKQRKLHASDMPWHNRKGEPTVSYNQSCAKTANLIQKFNKDIKSVKLYI